MATGALMPGMEHQQADGWRGFFNLIGQIVKTVVADGELHALDAATGQPRWTISLESGARSAGPAVADGQVFRAGSLGSLLAIDAATGAHQAS